MTPVPDARIQRTYRVRVALFAVGAALLLVLLSYFTRAFKLSMRWTKLNASEIIGNGHPM
jgi:hypothetical protein